MLKSLWRSLFGPAQSGEPPRAHALRLDGSTSGAAAVASWVNSFDDANAGPTADYTIVDGVMIDFMLWGPGGPQIGLKGDFVVREQDGTFKILREQEFSKWYC